MLLPIFLVTEKELKLKVFVLLQEGLTQQLKAGCEGKKNKRTNKFQPTSFPDKNHTSKSETCCVALSECLEG